MTFENDLRIKDCVSCGGCAAVCSRKAITMTYMSAKGFYYPSVDNSKCINCGLCLRVCPTINTKRSVSLLGEYEDIYLAYSNDYRVRHFASSGGVINSLVRYLVNERLVDGVIMVCMDCNSPIEASAMIVNTDNINLLVDTPRDFTSRYTIVPVLNLIDKLALEGRYAVVGTPCQISALKRIMDIYKLNWYRIGVTCSGGLSYLATSEYKRKMRSNSGKMYYRGDGWPGKNTIQTDTDSISYSHRGSLFERMFSSQIFKCHGCRLCTDHFVEDADVSFCDFWNSDEERTEREGKSCVIVRSPQMANFFSDMVLKGYISIDRSLSDRDVINTQYHILKSKKGNLRNMTLYKVFISVVDCVFRLRLYRIFSLSIYKFFCRAYTYLCFKSDIDSYM